MDTLSHGLWGGAVFGQERPSQWKWAFLWGMTPDLLSFGPFFLTHLPLIIHRWIQRSHMEPPDPRIIPAYVYHAYNVTHSLVVWTAMAGIAWVYLIAREKANRRNGTPVPRFPVSPWRTLWPFFAWPLHILCDIPTHSTRFFPTPYLWPLHTPFVNGRPWGRPPFTLINYLLIALTYLGLSLFKKRAQ